MKRPRGQTQNGLQVENATPIKQKKEESTGCTPTKRMQICSNIMLSVIAFIFLSLVYNVTFELVIFSDEYKDHDSFFIGVLCWRVSERKGS